MVSTPSDSLADQNYACPTNCLLMIGEEGAGDVGSRNFRRTLLITIGMNNLSQKKDDLRSGRRFPVVGRTSRP